MSVAVDEPDLAEEAEYQVGLRAVRKRMAKKHPAFFGAFVHAIDAKTGEEFDFDLLSEEERASIDLDGEPGGWYWHREILDSWLVQKLSLELKARQIGITWLAALYALWIALYRPGTRVLIISVNELEAQKVIARIWGMWKSLPVWMKEGLVVSKPSRGGDPSQEIEWTHPDDRRSVILALPATAKAGHGETGALVILDELSRQDFAKEIWKGVFPVIDGGGAIIGISTANGVSNPLTGEGNFFHYLWVNAMTMGITARFLAWFRHPDRDQHWYDTVATALPNADRAEQYPTSPEDAFINTGECWFDLAKLNWYQKKWRDAGTKIRRLRFVEEHLRARKEWTEAGEWRIIEEPDALGDYLCAADPATGRGTDFSSAHMIDLSNGKWVAEFHAKLPADQFATNLYYAGRMYNDAIVMIENQGGYGDAVIIPMRDGTKERKPYKNLYRHTKSEDNITPDEAPDYGYPMTISQRPLVISQLEQWINQRELPHITPELDSELRTFSRAKTTPSPRAQDGCNDDRVMSAAVSLEGYRQFGKRRKPQRPRGKARWKQTLYPWEAK